MNRRSQTPIPLLLRPMFGLSILWLCGCNNPCQDICRRMAAYAEECGLPVSDTEISSCVERQSDPERDDVKACRTYGDPETIRNQWTCEDLAGYWGKSDDGA